jgi:radical SAM superfamily enzyme YgiQ (UPF0313 family)
MARLLLINPYNPPKGLGNTRATAWPPLNLPYLAAVTPHHYQIEILDENIEPFEYQKADIVGITACTASVYRAYKIAEIYHKQGIRTVIGGIHASMLPEEALQYCDTVVIGEAETVWPKVLEDFEAGALKRQYEGSWASLDKLPIPRRDILRNDYYQWGTIQTSRGCPLNCTFCSVTAFNGRRFRRRPLDLVIEELEQIPQKNVGIVDDNIIGYGEKDKEWAYAFFSQILQKGIKKRFIAQASIDFGADRELVRLAARAGLKIIFVGIESVNPVTLRSYHKRINLVQLQHDRYKELIKTIRREGILFLGAFVVGSDDDDQSTFHSMLQFIKSSRIDVLQVTKLTPLPGTQLWKTLEKQGRIPKHNFPKAWSDFRLSKMVFEPAQMSTEEVYEAYTYLKRSYHSFWETTKRTLSTLLATKSPTETHLAYKLNDSYRKSFLAAKRYRPYNRPGLKKKFKLPMSPNEAASKLKNITSKA